MKKAAEAFWLSTVITLLCGIPVCHGAGPPKSISEIDGRYLDIDGSPTFKVQPDGTVDWSTFSGYRRYHAECHVCHGPDGEGSTYAPALKESVKIITYPDFLSIVALGRENVSTSQESVMPSFGENKNVACYLDDIYVYLQARANGAVPRGRPLKHEEKSEAAKKAEKDCME